MTTPAAKARVSRGDRFVLRDVRWKSYQSLLSDFSDRSGLFLTYHRGLLELMRASYKHNVQSIRLLLLFVELGVGTDLVFRTSGSTSLYRRDLKMGLEPDQSFYTRNVRALDGIHDIDLNVMPPPDLAIEVQISRRLKIRSKIYAALGIPELWTWKDDHLSVRILQGDGYYSACSHSPTFPHVPLADIDRLIAVGWNQDQLAWTLKVREWIANLPRPESNAPRLH